MNGLHFFIAVTEINREMRESVQGAGPHGGVDPEDERRHFARLRRLFSGATVEPLPVVDEQRPSEQEPAVAA